MEGKGNRGTVPAAVCIYDQYLYTLRFGSEQGGVIEMEDNQVILFPFLLALQLDSLVDVKIFSKLFSMLV